MANNFQNPWANDDQLKWLPSGSNFFNEDYNEQLARTQEIFGGGVNRKSASSVELKGAVPGCTGRVKLFGFQKEDFQHIRIIPENAKGDTDVFIPKSNGTYAADGFYCSRFTDREYWYKTSEGATVEITPHPQTLIAIIGTDNVLHCIDAANAKRDLFGGRGYVNGWEPKNRPHNTKNPFDTRG